MVFSAYMDTVKIIIFCAPSGAGKTTITHRMMDLFPQLAFSISGTNREPRGAEQDGVDYHFFTTEEFKRRVDAGEFLEWEEVYPGRYYGSLIAEINRLTKEGKIPVFDIDVKGAWNLKQRFGPRALMIFITAPTEMVITRLKDRSTDTPESIQVRIDRYPEEMTYTDKADVVIENIDLEKAVQETKTVIENFLRV